MFLFLIHVRWWTDLLLVHPELSGKTERELKKMFEDTPINKLLIPVKDKKTKEIKGWMGFMMKQGLKDLRKNIPEMVSFVKEAKKLCGEKHLVVGLGELTAPATRQGIDLRRKIDAEGITNVSITTGNSLTAATIFSSVKDLFEKKSGEVKPLSNSNVGIIGAAGSVAFVVAQLMHKERSCKKLTLVVNKATKNSIEEMSEKVKHWNHKEKLHITDEITDIKSCDCVIVLSSGNQVIVTNEMLKEGAIVYDATQPSNVDSDGISEARSDVLLVVGGLLETANYEFGMDLDLPEGQVYACLAETMIMSEISAMNDHIGPADISKARFMYSVVETKKWFAPTNVFFSPSKQAVSFNQE